MTDDQLMWALISRPNAAYHEAGHAIAALSVGGKVAQVNIEEDGRGSTLVEYSGVLGFERVRTVADARAVHWRRLLVVVAGPVASHLQSQRSYFGYWPTRRELAQAEHEMELMPDDLISDRFASNEPPGAFNEDLTRAHTTLVGLLQHKTTLKPVGNLGIKEIILPPQECLKAIRQAERQVETTLKRHWDAVELVANALLRSKVWRVGRWRLKKMVGSRFEG